MGQPLIEMATGYFYIPAEPWCPRSIMNYWSSGGKYSEWVVDDLTNIEIVRQNVGKIIYSKLKQEVWHYERTAK